MQTLILIRQKLKWKFETQVQIRQLDHPISHQGDYSIPRTKFMGYTEMGAGRLIDIYGNLYGNSKLMLVVKEGSQSWYLGSLLLSKLASVINVNVNILNPYQPLPCLIWSNAIMPVGMVNFW